jgi:hypothetical protein
MAYVNSSRHGVRSNVGLAREFRLPTCFTADLRPAYSVVSNPTLMHFEDRLPGSRFEPFAPPVVHEKQAPDHQRHKLIAHLDKEFPEASVYCFLEGSEVIDAIDFDMRGIRVLGVDEKLDNMHTEDNEPPQEKDLQPFLDVQIGHCPYQGKEQDHVKVHQIPPVLGDRGPGGNVINPDLLFHRRDGSSNLEPSGFGKANHLLRDAGQNRVVDGGKRIP